MTFDDVRTHCYCHACGDAATGVKCVATQVAVEHAAMRRAAPSTEFCDPECSCTAVGGSALRTAACAASASPFVPHADGQPGSSCSARDGRRSHCRPPVLEAVPDGVRLLPSVFIRVLKNFVFFIPEIPSFFFILKLSLAFFCTSLPGAHPAGFSFHLKMFLFGFHSWRILLLDLGFWVEPPAPPPALRHGVPLLYGRLNSCASLCNELFSSGCFQEFAFVFVLSILSTVCLL